MKHKHQNIPPCIGVGVVYKSMNMKRHRYTLAIRTLLCSAAFGVTVDQPQVVYSRRATTEVAADREDPNQRGYGRIRFSDGADLKVHVGDHHDDARTCRVAVCISGHIRSFVYPVVHRSIRTNLVEALEKNEGGCEVDVFAYATHSDAVPWWKQVR